MLDCSLKRRESGDRSVGGFLEQVIKWSIVGGTEKKWVALHCHEVSHGKVHQDSKGVVDEPSSENSEMEYQIDLKNTITQLFQTSKPDPFLTQMRYVKLPLASWIFPSAT